LKTILALIRSSWPTALWQAELENAEYQWQQTVDGPGAVAVLNRELPALLVIDLALPSVLDGPLRHWLRHNRNLPVLALASQPEEFEQALQEDLVDDFLLQPFSPRQWSVRVSLLLQRSSSSSTWPVKVGQLRIESARRRVTLAGRPVELTTSELALLKAMAADPGRVFTRSELQASLASAGSRTDRAVDCHIKNLRRKIESNPRQPNLVLTVHGIGYRLASSADRPASGATP
jgi:DNA-binding response OmpR family regulator